MNACKKIFIFVVIVSGFLINGIKVEAETMNDCSFSVDNEEMVTQMLQKSGDIALDENQLKKHNIFKKYTMKMQQNESDVNNITFKEKDSLKKIGNRVKNTPLRNCYKKDNSNQVRDKVLVILVDFPDLKFNMLKNTDTYFYYPIYNKEHYQKILFNKDGYKGPNGQDYMSLRQYYNIESNNTYDIEGNIIGPYTTDKNAAYYGVDNNNVRDVNSKELVKEILDKAAKDNSVNFSDFDYRSTENTGLDVNQPDKILDHIIIIHAGLGQEYGGGVLKTDAISSHASKVHDNDGVSPYKIKGSDYSAYKYCIEPEDGTVGVFAHEYAHDLGYHDEYDTKFNAGDSVSYWSIMSRGQWGGMIPGTEPVGFSPYAKEYFQGKYGKRWFEPRVISLGELSDKPIDIRLDQASIKGDNESVVKVELPDKVTKVNKPSSGRYEYWSGSGNKLNNSMNTKLKLKKYNSAKLTFKTWYSIEQNYDYAYIKVRCEGKEEWVTIPGNITVSKDSGVNGITGQSQGWQDAEFDLSAYCGKNIEISFNYNTDDTTFYDGFYVDDIKVQTDKSIILLDDCEDKGKFKLKGFSKNDGNKSTQQYYLLEWRNNTGVDKGLSNIKTVTGKIQYDTGLVIWYIDKAYDNNWVGSSEKGGHPGYGLIGVVDAEQNPIMLSAGKEVPASAELQMHDAAFSLKRASNINIQIPNSAIKFYDTGTNINNIFNDGKSYYNTSMVSSGRILPKFGLNIKVKAESNDRSSAIIELSKE